MTSVHPIDPNAAPVQKPIINIAILSDIRFVRDALVAIFERSANLRIVGAAAGFDGVFERVLALRPDVVLIDTAFPNGLSMVRPIKQSAPTVRVVALALAEQEEEVVAWAASGVAGYIPRSAALNDMVAILEGVMRDEQICSPRVASRLLRHLAINPPRLAESSSSTLTRRELEIVRLIGEGLSNKEIARRLSIGVATIKTHVHNALTKLGLGRRGAAAQWVREQAQTLPIRSSSL